MSESKQAGEVVFRVVDKRGGIHSITAKHMMTDGDVVKFFDGRNCEVASFVDPIGAMLAENATSATFADLVQGEACLSAFQLVSRGLLVVALAWSVVFVVSVGVEVYKLF